MSVSLGRLVDIEWKVGVSVSSSHVKNLDAAFVGLNVVIRNTAGKLENHTMELTIAEFNTLLNGLKDAQEAITKL